MRAVRPVDLLDRRHRSARRLRRDQGGLVARSCRLDSSHPGGWERGPIGYPTTDEFDLSVPYTPGVRLQDFTRGVELWSPTTGAHEVHGAILTEYIGLGGPGSVVGMPRTDETTTPDGVGRFNHFQAASIYWTPATGAHEVHGLIRSTWAESGWELGPLGYPVADESDAAGGRARSYFQHGYIEVVDGVASIHLT